MTKTRLLFASIAAALAWLLIQDSNGGRLRRWLGGRFRREAPESREEQLREAANEYADELRAVML